MSLAMTDKLKIDKYFYLYLNYNARYDRINDINN